MVNQARLSRRAFFLIATTRKKTAPAKGGSGSFYDNLVLFTA